MIIITVTLNPALDYLAFPGALRRGEINRFSRFSYGPGGKGINVSRLLSSLGMENTALAVAAGFTGKEIQRLMEQAGCKTDFLFLPAGSSRINFCASVPAGPGKDAEETVFNGEGPQIPEEALDRLGEKLSALGKGDALVLSGSVPPSLPRDAYSRLLERVEGKGVLTVVDAAGEALIQSLPRRPFLIKPNLEELEELFGAECRDPEAAWERAELLRKKGARNVLVSMGNRGALLVCEDGRRLFCRTVKGEAVSAVGAGDSLVAGFLYGLNLHGTMEGALKWGVAAGAATAFSHGVAGGALVKELYPKTGNVFQI